MLSRSNSVSLYCNHSPALVCLRLSVSRFAVLGESNAHECDTGKTMHRRSVDHGIRHDGRRGTDPPPATTGSTSSVFQAQNNVHRPGLPAAAPKYQKQPTISSFAAETMFDSHKGMGVSHERPSVAIVRVVTVAGSFPIDGDVIIVVVVFATQSSNRRSKGTDGDDGDPRQ